MLCLETNRLRLRQWQDSDYSSFAMLNADPDVMEYFPAPLSREHSDVMLDKARNLINKNGWGFWVVEEKTSGRLTGMTGLHLVEDDINDVLPGTSNIEIGWRLAKEFWGKGYATEAAMTARDYAFEVLKQEKIISFATRTNYRSIAVMQRIGMADTKFRFDHPRIPKDNPLSEHVLYELTRNDWSAIVQEN